MRGYPHCGSVVNQERRGVNPSDSPHQTVQRYGWRFAVDGHSFTSSIPADSSDLPGEGPLFPYLSTVRAGDRATEFGQRCRQLGIKGVTLHSYRYAWAERAKVCGYPERFAQEALGHNSKAVHRA